MFIIKPENIFVNSFLEKNFSKIFQKTKIKMESPGNMLKSQKLKKGTVPKLSVAI